MITDDPDKQSPADKERLLDEIRRRAEEAELKRLEKEEEPAPPPRETRPGHPPVSAPAPFPVPTSDHASQPPKAVRDQKILVLRERLMIALDRGKLEKASELLADLSGLIPGSSELEDFRGRIAVAQERRQAKEPTQPGAEARPKEEAAGLRDQRVAQRKKMVELLDAANNEYQQEKYDKALASVDGLLALDPASEEAEKLRQQIVKAQRIAELIKREEARRKAEDAADRPEPEPSLPPLSERSDKDFWGSPEPVEAPDLGLELPPEEKGPVGPPRPPLSHRIVRRLSGIRIPVKPLITAGIVLVALSAGYVIVDNIRNAVNPPLYSVLILPAAPVPSDSALAWIADGLTDEVIRDLSQVSVLRVFGTGTSLAFRGAGRDALKSARNIGANFALQWTVSRTSSGIALEPTFYDTLDSKPRWTTHLEMSLRELPAVRQELTRKLLQAMNVKLAPEEDAALNRSTTTSPDAYEAYLRARSLLLHLAGQKSTQIIEAFGQSVHADSVFSDAQSGLGWAYVLAYENDKDAPPSYLERARLSVQRAAMAAPRNPENFRVWGMTEYFRLQNEKAIERFEQAVTIAPSDAETWRRLAVTYLVAGKSEAALKAARKAVDHDPGNVASYTTLGQVLQFDGKFKDALRSYEQGLRLSPDKSDYGSGAYNDLLFYTQQSDRAIAILMDRVARLRDSYADFYKLARLQQSAGKPIAEWQATLQHARTILDERVKADPQDDVAYSWMALVLTRLGAFKDALAASKQAQQIDPNDVDVLYNAARMYALHRDKAQAYEQLARAISRRYSLARILDMDFYNLRSEEEFIKTVTR
jgi:tetratricopeptide (TPR) repeat protein